LLFTGGERHSNAASLDETNDTKENFEVLKRMLVAVLLTTAGLLVHTAARADIFRCADSRGTVMFTDTPCPSGMRTTGVIAAAQDRGVPQGGEAVEPRSAEREQSLIREGELRRIEQDLAAREEALRSAQQELAVREEEGLRRAQEEEARLKMLAPAGEIAPVTPYYEVPVWYPVVVVPSRPCSGPRCFPHHPQHEPDGSHHHDSHGDHHPMHGDGRSYAKQRS